MLKVKTSVLKYINENVWRHNLTPAMFKILIDQINLKQEAKAIFIRVPSMLKLNSFQTIDKNCKLMPHSFKTRQKSPSRIPSALDYSVIVE